MKIIFLGSGQFGIAGLDALKGSSHSLAFIITQPAHRAGRGRKLAPTPVACWAKERSIDSLETDNVNEPDIIEKISKIQPDLIIVIAFGQKIGNELINLPPKGMINVHASLLPKFRGAAPINAAIINGEKQTGISIITLAEKMDAGDILSQCQTDILENETAGHLHDRLAQLAAPLLLDTIAAIADGTATYSPQDHSKATLALKLKKEDGFVDFNEPAQSLVLKVRGLWPWPGVSAVYTSKKTQKSLRITIAEAFPVKTSNPANLPPGVLDEDLNIICGCDALAITKIKPQGSHLMDFKDFINGRGTRPGDIFTKIEM